MTPGLAVYGASLEVDSASSTESSDRVVLEFKSRVDRVFLSRKHFDWKSSLIFADP